MGKYYRSSGSFRKVERSSLCSGPIKIIICLALSIHLSYYFLRYLFYDESAVLADTEIRKTFLNVTTNTTTYLLPDMRKISQLIEENQEGRGRVIPRIIHQSWNNYNIPQMTIKWVKRWKETNPDWTYIFWTDRSSRDFIANFFPDYLPLYDDFELPVQRADLFRYFVLWAIGGVYADLDVEPLRSLNEIALSSPCILSREPDVHSRLLHPEFSTKDNNFTLACNAFMMCRSRHPYMAFLINQIAERRAKVPTCPLGETLLCTGPYILSTAWVKYKALYYQHIKNYPDDDVICPASDYFLPTWDPLRNGWVRAICMVKKRYDKLSASDQKICDRVKSEKFRNEAKDWSYTNHHWFHSWTEERTRYLSRRYTRSHIFSIVPEVIYGTDLASVTSPNVVDMSRRRQ